MVGAYGLVIWAVDLMGPSCMGFCPSILQDLELYANPLIVEPFFFFLSQKDLDYSINIYIYISNHFFGCY